ncbi:GGDEF domain-containing protein [Aliivibrio fischeri]|uniref:GGDEF domain-containing protein n=1 Tax=Aliivibrio fischeri TaxID=668 RepID=UPI0012DA91C8|nr:GGDEF domain-containing protein [Aliivibrio fischeri]MUL11046.1 diguanylate cyclase [Aliivibrio fischeri]MUL13194.1 diguanylate cyclase [Aliivibrio fischeri]
MMIVIKKIASFLFVNLIVFIVSYCLYYSYNKIKYDELDEYIQVNLYKVFDNLEMISSFYANAPFVSIDKGLHNIEKVGIYAPQDGEIKSLSRGISIISEKLKDFIGDDFWSLGVIDTNNKNTIYFSPMRVPHIQIFLKSDFDFFNHVLTSENLPSTYELSLENGLFRQTEPYKESFNEQSVRSIYYPIYIKRDLKALLLLDVKSTLYQSWTEKFNRDQFTVLNIDESNDSGLIKKISLPYTINCDLYLYMDKSLLLKYSFFFSFLITLVLHYAGRSLHYLVNFYGKDTMTECIRRDIIEPKLRKKIFYNQAIIMVDIDFFKKINDEYGHGFGDEVIKTTASLLKRNIRKSDTCIRWGGEEFMIILNGKNIDLDFLVNKAEQLRFKIEEQTLLHVDFTVSVGIALGKKQKFTEVLKRADMALYHAKNNGRNQVAYL